MTEFFSQNQMYVVLFVVLLVWAGIVAYLFRLDKRVKDIENTFNKGS